MRADPYDLKRASNKVLFVIETFDDSGLSVEEEARFLGPVSGPHDESRGGA